MIEFRPVIAETGKPHGEPFSTHGPAEVAAHCAVAGAAFDINRAATREAGGAFLERIAAEILDLDDSSIEAANLLARAEARRVAA